MSENESTTKAILQDTFRRYVRIPDIGHPFYEIDAGNEAVAQALNEAIQKHYTNASGLIQHTETGMLQISEGLANTEAFQLFLQRTSGMLRTTLQTKLAETNWQAKVPGRMRSFEYLTCPLRDCISLLIDNPLEGVNASFGADDGIAIPRISYSLKINCGSQTGDLRSLFERALQTRNAASPESDETAIVSDDFLARLLRISDSAPDLPSGAEAGIAYMEPFLVSLRNPDELISVLQAVVGGAFRSERISDAQVIAATDIIRDIQKLNQQYGQSRDDKSR